MLSNKDTGERAFPFFDERKMNTPEYGLTIRDYFATTASDDDILAIHNKDYEEWDNSETFKGNYQKRSRAAARYMHADNMLMERSK